MGANMAARLLQGGHSVVAYDFNESADRTRDEVVAKLPALRNQFGGHTVKRGT